MGRNVAEGVHKNAREKLTSCLSVRFIDTCQHRRQGEGRQSERIDGVEGYLYLYVERVGGVEGYLCVERQSGLIVE